MKIKQLLQVSRWKIKKKTQGARTGSWAPQGRVRGLPRVWGRGGGPTGWPRPGSQAHPVPPTSAAPPRWSPRARAPSARGEALRPGTMGPRRLLLVAAGLSLCWPLLSARAPSHEPGERQKRPDPGAAPTPAVRAPSATVPSGSARRSAAGPGAPGGSGRVSALELRGVLGGGVDGRGTARRPERKLEVA